MTTTTERADRAEAALRKYADAKNWKCSLCVHDAEHVDGICCNDFFEPTLDGYEIARQALDDPVVIQDDGSGNQITASGRVLR